MEKQNVLQIYRKYNHCPFLNEYGKEYVKLLKNINKEEFYAGPKRYLSKIDIYHFCIDFMNKTFGSNKANEFKLQLDRKIMLYTKEEIEEIINILETGNHSTEEISNIRLCLEEARDLLNSRGSLLYINENLWTVNVLTKMDIATGMTLVHEWIHKMNNDSQQIETDEMTILDEALAYYGSYLFAEYISSQGLAYDAKLALEEIDMIHKESIKSFIEIEAIVSKLKSKLELETIHNLVEDDSFALNNYHHILGHLLAKYIYYNQEENSYEEKSHWLKQTIKKPINLNRTLKEIIKDGTNNPKSMEKIKKQYRK